MLDIAEIFANYDVSVLKVMQTIIRTTSEKTPQQPLSEPTSLSSKTICFVYPTGEVVTSIVSVSSQ